MTRVLLATPNLSTCHDLIKQLHSNFDFKVAKDVATAVKNMDSVGALVLNPFLPLGDISSELKDKAIKLSKNYQAIPGLSSFYANGIVALEEAVRREIPLISVVLQRELPERFKGAILQYPNVLLYTPSSGEIKQIPLDIANYL
ncbi:MAG: hypothetical protein J7L43_02295 [Candidatus Aenigmarchaeota archaeon]|nr:hypothetical protein [Candidatus Aenigmarchaeota archaeon]